MVGITPLNSQVPASAPTINKINIAFEVDFTFSATSVIILLKETRCLKPTIAATAPPINKINWLVPLRASSPKIKTLYASIPTKANTGMSASHIVNAEFCTICCS